MKLALASILTLGFAVAPPLAMAQDEESESQRACPGGRIPEDTTLPGLPVYPFYGMGLYPGMPNEVTLYLNADLKSVTGVATAVRSGIDRWKVSCQANTIPINFHVNAQGTRPQVDGLDSPAYGTTVLLELWPQRVAERSEDGLVLSAWQGDRNRIEIFGMCPDKIPRGDRVCLRPNVPINLGGKSRAAGGNRRSRTRSRHGPGARLRRPRLR
jgi:hypothetical protein